MQTKCKTLIKIGAGIAVGATILYFLYNTSNKNTGEKQTDSIDEIVEREPLNFQNVFGDVPYSPILRNYV